MKRDIETCQIRDVSFGSRSTNHSDSKSVDKQTKNARFYLRYIPAPVSHLLLALTGDAVGGATLSVILAMSTAQSAVASKLFIPNTVLVP